MEEQIVNGAEQPNPPPAVAAGPALAGLIQKLARVRQKHGYIQKKGRNTFHGYAYVTAADIAGRIGDGLAEEGVMMYCRALHVEPKMMDKGTRVHIQMEYVFTDGLAEIAVPGFGDAVDSGMGDKAVYKAMTGALKYVLLQTFLLEAGDDPEEDDLESTVDGTRKASPPAQRKPPVQTKPAETPPNPPAGSTPQNPAPTPPEGVSGANSATPEQVELIRKYCRERKPPQSEGAVCKYLSNARKSPVEKLEQMTVKEFETLDKMMKPKEG